MSPVSPQQIERYRRDGFVVVEGLLRDAELARFGAAVDRAVAQRCRADARPLGERSLSSTGPVPASKPP